MNNYDLTENLPSPSMDALNEMLNSPSFFDFNKASTPPGMNPSNHSSLNSPPQSTTLSDMFPFDEFLFNSSGNSYQPTAPYDNLGTTLPTNDQFEGILMNNSSRTSLSDTNISFDTSLELEDDKLSIIAEPKAFYRERYYCETDPQKNRAQRYIRTDNNNCRYEHPTVKIPSKWRNSRQKLYIRVIPITIKTMDAPYHCIHPYEINTQENNVMIDRANNSLYFPINDNELITGEKSFLISRKKMIQYDLKSYGPFRLFDTNQPDSQRVQNPQDPKQIIAAYQLWKSQFVFTIAELQNNNSVLALMLQTSVISRIITDETVDSSTDYSSGTSIIGIKCIPQTGSWAGGDEVLIIMPNRIKKKDYKIYFDFGQYGQKPVNEIMRVDTKTILFRTPPCLIIPGDENMKISIIIQENKSIIPPIDFYYMTPIKTTINICSRCRGNVMDKPVNNKRRWEYDSGESLFSKMNRLAIEQKTIESHSRISTDANTSKVDKYLNQLKDALEIFVRTNDPSRVFRRTRILLSKYHGNSSPLHDAIQCGHTQLALALIEQIIDMPSPNRLLENENDDGETPLLIAAKLNEWKLMECILKSRSDLAKQKDKDGNNLLHLLANLSEDKGVKTIENVLAILPNEVKVNLLKEQNQKHQTLIEIAESHDNTQCSNLLKLLTGV